MHHGGVAARAGAFCRFVFSLGIQNLCVMPPGGYVLPVPSAILTCAVRVRTCLIEPNRKVPPAGEGDPVKGNRYHHRTVMSAALP